MRTIFICLLIVSVVSVQSLFLDTSCIGTIVNCFVEPCRFAKCENHPNAVCRDNYCNGCHADFYEGAHKVDCTAPIV